MKKNPNYEEFVSSDSKLLDTWFDRKRCRKCGQLFRIEMISNSDSEKICKTCSRNEKIDSVLD